MYNRSYLNFKNRFRFHSSKKFISVGLFGDTHFQEKGLDKLIATGNWISEQCKNRKVDLIVCLGDVLNTRDFVNVEAQSAAFHMFRQMRVDNPSTPIHIVLGNHDMNLRHSRRISSLDGLSVGSNSNIHLHTQIHQEIIGGVPCLFIPYHHEPEDIIQYVENLKLAEKNNELDFSLDNMVVFGHLSVHGAKQNDGRKFQGSIHSSLFSPFKHTFSGHYHYHHTLDHNVVYVGSPMQFNFGDAGHDRGIVVYDAKTNTLNQIVNSFSPRFHKMSEEEIETNTKSNQSIFKDAHVMIKFEQPKPFSVFQELREKLVNLGCVDVRRENAIEKVIKNPYQPTHTPTHHDIPMILEQYVKSVDKALKGDDKEQKSVQQIFENEEKLKILLAEGLDILKDVNDRTLQLSSRLSNIFDGDLASIKIEGFMSFSDPVEIRIKDMNDGIWMIEGENGSGKSSIFEAIVWCHFGNYLRSELTKDHGINNNSKRSLVRVEYENGFVIERERKIGKADELRTFQRDGNNLVPLDQNEKGAVKNSQKKLNDHIGIEYKVFSKSVLLGQNIVNNFISGSRDDRRLIIEEMLGLEKFGDYYEEAHERLKALNNALNELGFESTKNKEKMTKSREDIRKLEARRESEEDELQAAQDNYESQLKLKNQKIALIGTQKDQLEKTILENEEKLIEIKKRIENGKQMELSQNQLTDVAQVLSGVKGELKKLGPMVSKLQKLEKEEKCPLCGQAVTEEEMKAHSDPLLELKDILKKNTELSEFQLCEDAHITNAVELCKTIITALESKLDKNEKVIAQIKGLENEQSETLSVYNKAERDLKQIQDRYVIIDKEESDMLHHIELKKIEFQSGIRAHTAQIEDLLKDLQEVMLTENQVQERKKEKESLYEISKFWDLAFDAKNKKNSGIVNLRSYIFAESISELNLLLEDYMEQFSQGLNRELTSTLNSDLELLENYGKRSGGERKRTDLAVLFSLFELVRSRSRYLPRFIMLDEVFDALDKNGKSAVRAILMRLSSSKQLRKIFVITHSDIATGISTAGTINVEKQFLEGIPRTAVHIHQSSS